MQGTNPCRSFHTWTEEISCGPPKRSRHLEELPLGDGYPSHSFLLLRCLLPPDGDGLCSWLAQGGRLGITSGTCCCCRQGLWAASALGCTWDLGESQPVSPWGWSLLSRSCSFLAFLADGAVQILRQTKPPTGRTLQRTLQIRDRSSGSDFLNTCSRWYRHKPGEAQRSSKAHSGRAIG